jgi:hypothetical protein
MNDPPQAIEPSDGPGGKRDAPWPEPRQAWWTIFGLGLVTTSAQLDLSIVSLLVQSIKRDLGIADSQMSLLLGFSFAFFYSLVGLPISFRQPFGHSIA